MAAAIYLSFLAMGMLLYTLINSAGYFIQRREWPMVGMFAALGALTLINMIWLISVSSPLIVTDTGPQYVVASTMFGLERIGRRRAGLAGGTGSYRSTRRRRSQAILSAKAKVDAVRLSPRGGLK